MLKKLVHVHIITVTIYCVTHLSDVFILYISDCACLWGIHYNQKLYIYIGNIRCMKCRHALAGSIVSCEDLYRKYDIIVVVVVVVVVWC